MRPETAKQFLLRRMWERKEAGRNPRWISIQVFGLPVDETKTPDPGGGPSVSN